MIDTGDFRLSADERVRQARRSQVFPRLAKVDPPEMLRGTAKGASRREAGSREATAGEWTSPGGAAPGRKRKGHEGREEPEVYRSDETRRESLLYLVEDDADQAMALAAELEAYGFEVRRFGSFQEAREALAAKRPQALIMDMMLPEGALGGARGLAELRQTGAADVPVIFLSARTDMAARLEAVRAGAQAYFAKPPDLALLVDRLDELTDRRAAEPYRVLIVDDDPLMALQHRVVLRRAGMVVRTLGNPMAVLSAVDEFEPDLVLLDYMMPGCTGPEVAAVVRQRPELVGLPIVFLSSEDREDRILEARGAGAEDFLLKPVAPERLISEVRLRADRWRAVRYFLSRDGQTGLLNPAAFAALLERRIASAARRKESAVLALLDVDRLKQINARHGRRTGDGVLHGLVRVLKKHLGNQEVIGRCGGDEFGILFEGIAPKEALRKLEVVRAAFEALPHRVGAQPFRAGFSAGVASFPRYATASALMEAVEEALKAAKGAGPGSVVSAGPTE